MSDRSDRPPRPDRTIPELLAEHGPATGPDLAELLDSHPLTVERRCSDLQRAGRIRQDTGGRYTLWGTPGDAAAGSD
jgi:DNA-binding IclR family transcriptional regulator